MKLIALPSNVATPIVKTGQKQPCLLSLHSNDVFFSSKKPEKPTQEETTLLELYGLTKQANATQAIKSILLAISELNGPGNTNEEKRRRHYLLETKKQLSRIFGLPFNKLAQAINQVSQPFPLVKGQLNDVPLEEAELFQKPLEKKRISKYQESEASEIEEVVATFLDNLLSSSSRGGTLCQKILEKTDEKGSFSLKYPTLSRNSRCLTDEYSQGKLPNVELVNSAAYGLSKPLTGPKMLKPLIMAQPQDSGKTYLMYALAKILFNPTLKEQNAEVILLDLERLGIDCRQDSELITREFSQIKQELASQLMHNPTKKIIFAMKHAELVDDFEYRDVGKEIAELQTQYNNFRPICIATSDKPVEKYLAHSIRWDGFRPYEAPSLSPPQLEAIVLKRLNKLFQDDKIATPQRTLKYLLESATRYSAEKRLPFCIQVASAIQEILMNNNAKYHTTIDTLQRAQIELMYLKNLDTLGLLKEKNQVIMASEKIKTIENSLKKIKLVKNKNTTEKIVSIEDMKRAIDHVELRVNSGKEMLDPSQAYNVLSKNIKGQDEALKIVHNAINETVFLRKENTSASVGLSLLLVGPSGVGKTSLCSLLEKNFSSNIITYDFSHGFPDVELFGSDVRNPEIETLAQKLDKNPDSIVFFDEIDKLEKPEELDKLLSMLNNGTYTDKTGKVCDLRRATVILATNAKQAHVAEIMLKQRKNGTLDEGRIEGEVRAALLTRHGLIDPPFNSALLSRIMHVVPFSYILDEDAPPIFKSLVDTYNEAFTHIPNGGKDIKVQLSLSDNALKELSRLASLDKPVREQPRRLIGFHRHDANEESDDSGIIQSGARKIESVFREKIVNPYRNAAYMLKKSSCIRFDFDGEKFFPVISDFSKSE